MAELPIMPMKTDAILSDCINMNTEEFGAYCRLLFAMWRNGGRLVDDPQELANIAGVPLKHWTKIAGRVMRPMTVGGGQVSQKRLSDTWEQVQKLRAKRAGAANKRWSSNSDANASANGYTHASSMHPPLQSTSNANQNQISKPSLSTSVSVAAHEKESLEGSLATALPEGALREPSRGATPEVSTELKRLVASKWGVKPAEPEDIPTFLRRSDKPANAKAS